MTDSNDKKNNSSSEIKTFLGLPMRWEGRNIFKNLWNKETDEIFPPKHFGIGWDLNLHALLKAAGVIKDEPISKYSAQNSDKKDNE